MHWINISPAASIVTSTNQLEGVEMFTNAIVSVFLVLLGVAALQDLFD